MLEALLVDLAQIGELPDQTDRIRRSGLRAVRTLTILESKLLKKTRSETSA